MSIVSREQGSLFDQVFDQVFGRELAPADEFSDLGPERNIDPPVPVGLMAKPCACLRGSVLDLADGGRRCVRCGRRSR